MERSAVVGEETVVVAVEEFDRFEDQERRIRHTVAVAQERKSEEYKRTTINIDNLVGRKKAGGRRGSVGRQQRRIHMGLCALGQYEVYSFTSVVFSSGKVGFR